MKKKPCLKSVWDKLKPWFSCVEGDTIMITTLKDSCLVFVFMCFWASEAVDWPLCRRTWSSWGHPSAPPAAAGQSTASVWCPGAGKSASLCRTQTSLWTLSSLDENYQRTSRNIKKSFYMHNIKLKHKKIQVKFYGCLDNW